MLHTLKEPERDIVSLGFRELYVRAFNWMLLTRTVEEKLASLYRAGKIVGGVYLGRGQEAISVALGVVLRAGDIFGPLIRDQAGRLAFGEPLVEVFRAYFGSKFGMTHGRDGNVHRGRPKEGYLAMISHLGALIPVVAGALMARRFRGDTSAVGATTIGDGGTSVGAFHEGMNLAAVEKLPMVVVITNNHYAYSTPNERQFACHDLVDRAIGYGFEGYSMDGTDLKECLEVVRHAVDRARSGHGPQMVVASCVRLTGHGEHDDASYVDRALLQSPIGRDCVKVAEQYVLEQGWADSTTVNRWKQEARHQVEQALAQVQHEPAVSAAEQDWSPLATKRLLDPVCGQ
jgi:pyruvate dehydrogenase E1 component alpha subunit/2-oxoisovalerate dehydrogenase E1 component alpha subunit